MSGRDRTSDRIADWRSGALEGADREAFERDLAASDELAEAFYAEIALDGALDKARAERSGVVPIRPRRRGLAWAVALPLAAGLALLVLRLGGGDEAPTLRGGASDFRPTVDLSGDTPVALGWTAVPGAARYAVAVTDSAGTELWRTTTAATQVDVPELSGDTALYWSVRALDAQGFEIDRTGPRIFSRPAAEGRAR